MTAREKFLSYGRQTIEDDDVTAVAEALRRDFLTTGPLVESFESAFCDATGARHAVVCNSGTAALHLAALAAGLGPGDTAIAPSLTFLATANAVRFTGAEVTFADVDPNTGLLTADTLAAAIEMAVGQGRRVKAALPVHLNGQLCDMSKLAEVAGRYGVALIEDACHALGVKDAGATNHSRAACFSTHPVKAITTGEGGMVTTSDASLAERMRRLRNHGMARAPDVFQRRELAFDGATANPWYYEMSEIGWNYRLPDILCALGISQLKKLDRFRQRRHAIAILYDKLLSPLAPALNPVPHDVKTHGFHLYALLIDYPALRMTRRRFMEELRAAGIGTQVHYLPVHQQPYYRARYGAMSLPGAEAYYARCLSIPIFPSMGDSDVRYVAGTLANIVQKAAA